MSVNVTKVIVKTKPKKEPVKKTETIKSIPVTNDININSTNKQYYIDSDGIKRPLIKKSDFLLDMMGIEELQGE